MKKASFFCLCITLVAMFTSCNKDNDGSYSPAQKIQKIYYYNKGVPHLEESWHWNGNILSSIDNYSSQGNISSTVHFDYDGNRIIKATTDRATRPWYAIYHYDGNKIKTIEEYFPGYDVPFSIYNFEYDGNKIVKMVGMKDLYNGGYWDEFMKATTNPLKYILPQSCEPLVNMINKHIQDTKDPSLAFTMKLTWTGDNVSKAELEEDDFYSVTECTFDNKENPMNGFVYCLHDGMLNGESGVNRYCNKNNIKTMTITTSSSLSILNGTSEWEYEYEYNKDNYPTRVIIKSLSYNSADTILYEY